jgi:hypothetical protein
MTIAELESSLNLSFHDALLHSLTIDFVARRAELILDVCVGNPDAACSAERERRRRGDSN